MPRDLSLMAQHSWILDPETRAALPRKPVEDSSVLTCYLQLHSGFFSGITIFKKTVVLPPIKNTDFVDSEGHFALSQGLFQDHCVILIVLNLFSREFILFLVNGNRLVVISIPAHLHVVCTLWGGQLAAELSMFTYHDHLLSAGGTHSELLCG